jgi:bifunctional DNA-binding transcriptional regulator/antitoxin component of YhaV-PrlF toxin-antitoxin module
MSSSTISRDYKITLPKELSEEMHIQPGQKSELIQNGKDLLMIPKFSVEELKAAIAAGLASGQALSATEVFSRLENKYRKLAAGK